MKHRLLPNSIKPAIDHLRDGIIDQSHDPHRPGFSETLPVSASDPRSRPEPPTSPWPHCTITRSPMTKHFMPSTKIPRKRADWCGAGAARAVGLGRPAEGGTARSPSKCLRVPFIPAPRSPFTGCPASSVRPFSRATVYEWSSLKRRETNSQPPPSVSARFSLLAFASSLRCLARRPPHTQSPSEPISLLAFTSRQVSPTTCAPRKPSLLLSPLYASPLAQLKLNLVPSSLSRHSQSPHPPNSAPHLPHLSVPLPDLLPIQAHPHPHLHQQPHPSSISTTQVPSLFLLNHSPSPTFPLPRPFILVPSTGGVPPRPQARCAPDFEDRGRRQEAIGVGCGEWGEVLGGEEGGEVAWD